MVVKIAAKDRLKRCTDLLAMRQHISCLYVFQLFRSFSNCCFDPSCHASAVQLPCSEGSSALQDVLEAKSQLNQANLHLWVVQVRVAWKDKVVLPILYRSSLPHRPRYRCMFNVKSGYVSAVVHTLQLPSEPVFCVALSRGQCKHDVKSRERHRSFNSRNQIQSKARIVPE